MNVNIIKCESQGKVSRKLVLGNNVKLAEHCKKLDVRWRITACLVYACNMSEHNKLFVDSIDCIISDMNQANARQIASDGYRVH